MTEIEQLMRPNILRLTPYSSARSEFKGEASVWLDANESPFNTPYNRYPDPLQSRIKEKIARIKGLSPDSVFLGAGSDEAIDLLFRVFCIPARDNAVAIEPTYGMYEVCANINDVEYRKVPLDEEFDFDPVDLLAVADDHTKLLFICSPNNPTGNTFDASKIKYLLDNFRGILVIDEAYIDFSSQDSFLKRLPDYPRLVILQTFSKAWGSAGVRLGMAFASSGIIEVFNKVKYPYNINALTQEYALEILEKEECVKEWVDVLLRERLKLETLLQEFPFVTKVYPSDANFLLVRTRDAAALYNYLQDKGIIVRNRNKITLCSGCLRITVGNAEENRILVEALAIYGK
ncbi:histidinol-phosphate transaminase [Barnesiella propionica]|uniref:histidinol-phosphate transaminase n=1 Tax=Barnesiella propionica TaxID=2981781 RepID=UPI0011CA67C5|nr:histidinol-phosphate transaminase [Barnesiella propionica]MCU6767595.1 histidinol-phosphate transaminase [Barnesiella propionica]